jgi:hypothetical protein
MGDYGFEGAGEFAGMDSPMSEDVLKDLLKGEFHFTKCPQRQSGLFGDDFTDSRLACKLSASPDADGRGFGYNECDFSGDDYRQCPRYSEGMSRPDASGSRRVSRDYVSVAGEFHKLGNMEEGGVRIPDSGSYKWRGVSSNKAKKIVPVSKPFKTVYHRGPADNLYVYG